ncbi:VOC family protein [Homoserinibacter sp. YIM 151385]|uniref:VOC family protein n=1 Tax=Homoserinibacter sp. YIM 151385 TaxID=2985506 RepID=UPI0022F07AA4|nr:VOC family protein [Homoserinibacter sp. YIM 151385]WBU37088.1 VOC family protein [Homoserinibacter sp. YIM 151385]
MRAIDHVAVAVRDADSAMRYYLDVLGLELVGDEVAEDPGVRLVYLAAGPDRVQLVQPLRPGPVQTWIEERGEGLHHVCFEVGDIPAVLGGIPGQAERPVFRGGRGRRACFLAETPTGVNIELTETEPSF